MNNEQCQLCAGHTDDSIYVDCGKANLGPLCEDCVRGLQQTLFHDLQNEIEDLKSDLEAEIDQLREDWQDEVDDFEDTITDMKNEHEDEVVELEEEISRLEDELAGYQ